MKKFILKLFGLETLIAQAYENGLKDGAKNNQEQQELRRLKVNYPVGTLVMHLSAQSPIQKATVIGHEQIKNSSYLVLKDENGKEFITGGKVLLFDQNRWESFQKLLWWEQHNVGTEWGPSLDAQKAKNLEEGRPAWDNGDGVEND